MKAFTFAAIFILLSFWPKLVLAQKDVTPQQFIWYGYFLTVPLDENWFVVAEIQERHFVHPFAQHQWSLRSHLHRKLGESGWEASAGFAAFFQSPNNPNSGLDLVEPELRPHIELAYKQKLGKLTFDHRYRAEARYFHNLNLDETELADGYFFGGFRIRYRILASYPIWKINEEKSLRLVVGDEIMLQAGKKVIYAFDQNRLIAGLGINLSSAINMEATYQKWINQRQTGGYYNRDILRFTVNQRLGMNKKRV
ncbi:DUF2490 domain-containing protein [uncultured Algoriphagus sp.]|uniref:DUF2490 domain-containing protein n=1 Tax=uncultured Algoriphagus sp. TaxID=417365 RepID=UPI0030EB7316